MVSLLDMCSSGFQQTQTPRSRGTRGHNNSGGDDRIRTGEWRFCRPLPYHLATSPQRDSSILARRCQSAIDSGGSVWYDIYQLISFELRIIEHPTSPQMWGFVSPSVTTTCRGEGAQR